MVVKSAGDGIFRSAPTSDPPRSARHQHARLRIRARPEEPFSLSAGVGLAARPLQPMKIAEPRLHLVGHDSLPTGPNRGGKPIEPGTGNEIAPGQGSVCETEQIGRAAGQRRPYACLETSIQVRKVESCSTRRSRQRSRDKARTPERFPAPHRRPAIGPITAMLETLILHDCRCLPLKERSWHPGLAQASGRCLKPRIGQGSAGAFRSSGPGELPPLARCLLCVAGSL